MEQTGNTKGVTIIDLMLDGIAYERLQDSLHSIAPPEVEKPAGIDMLGYFHLYQSNAFVIRYSFRRRKDDMTKIFDVGITEEGKYYAICVDMSPYSSGLPFPYKFMFTSISEVEIIKIILAFTGKQLVDMAEEACIAWVDSLKLKP